MVAQNIPTRIIQLSDLHLTGQIGKDTSYHAFLACLTKSLSYAPDFYLLTGDLANHGDTQATDWLFDTLKRTGVPFFAVAGNHDVTIEHNLHLPFELREFSPKIPDNRLCDCHAICINHWQILLLDSSISGQIYGKLNDYQLDWLHHTLSNNPSNAIIALHHPPVSVNSAWIDAYQLQNADKFWQIIDKHRHAKLVLSGHVHQTHTLICGHTTVHTALSTHRQFMPYADDFCIDTNAGGFVIIDLNDKNCQLSVHRLSKNLG